MYILRRLYLALCLAFQRGSVREITSTFSWLYFYICTPARARSTHRPDAPPRPSDEGSVPRSRLRFIHTPHSVRSFNVFGSTQCSAAPRARAPRRAPTPLSRLRHAQSVSRLSSPNLAVYGSRGRLGCLGCFNSCCCCDQLLRGGESVHRLVSQHQTARGSGPLKNFATSALRARGAISIPNDLLCSRRRRPLFKSKLWSDDDGQ